MRQNVEVKGNKQEPIQERGKTSGIDQVSKIKDKMCEDGVENMEDVEMMESSEEKRAHRRG